MRKSAVPEGRALIKWLLVSAAVAIAAAAGMFVAYRMVRSPAPPHFQALDITVVPWGRSFVLQGAAGQRRTLADFHGKVVMLTFGYTRCRDVCPATLALLGETMKRMGADAERVQGLFVTVDPRRDTPEVLSRYVAAFHPSFLGLYGDPEAIERTAREFKIFYGANPPGGDEPYAVDHSGQVYLFDPVGRLRLLVKPEASSPESIAHDVRLLLAEATG